MDVREQMKLQQWAADMAEKEASGLTAAQWCEMKEITENGFYYRCKRVRTAMQEMADAESTKELMISPSRQPSTDFAKIELIAPKSIPAGGTIGLKRLFGKVMAFSCCTNVWSPEDSVGQDRRRIFVI